MYIYTTYIYPIGVYIPIGITDNLLPKYTHTHTYTDIYIYVYI